MSWFKISPLVSLVLMFLVNTLFGWYISQSTIGWSQWLTQHGRGLGWGLEQDLVSVTLHILAALSILAITFALTAPVALISIFLGSRLQSDIRATISLLCWSFAVVLMICWLEYFVRFLVLLCAAMLARLELLEAKYNNWQTFAILAVISGGGFGTGVLMFEYFHRHAVT